MGHRLRKRERQAVRAGAVLGQSAVAVTRDQGQMLLVLIQQQIDRMKEREPLWLAHLVTTTERDRRAMLSALVAQGLEELAAALGALDGERLQKKRMLEARVVALEGLKAQLARDTTR